MKTALVLALVWPLLACDGTSTGGTDAGAACSGELCPGDTCLPGDELAGCRDQYSFLDCVAATDDGNPCTGDAGVTGCGFPGVVALRDCRDECYQGTCFSGADFSGCSCSR